MSSASAYPNEWQPKRKLSTAAKASILILVVVCASAGFALATYYLTVTVPFNVQPLSMTQVYVGTTTGAYDIGICSVSGSTATCSSLTISGSAAYISMNVVNSASAVTAYNVWFSSTTATVLSVELLSSTLACVGMPPASTTSPTSCTFTQSTTVALVFLVSVLAPGTSTITVQIGTP